MSTELTKIFHKKKLNYLIINVLIFREMKNDNYKKIMNDVIDNNFIFKDEEDLI